MGDRFGRREIIWFSILGAVPFTLIMPFANLFWTVVLTVTTAQTFDAPVESPYLIQTE